MQMKVHPAARRQARPGFTLIEALVTSLIVTISVASVVSMWYFAYNMDRLTDDQGVAYNLGRSAIEQVHETGFYDTAEAPAASPVVYYYDHNEVNQTLTPSKAQFKVTVSVVSDKTNGATSGQTWADDALRTVTVTVTRLSDGRQLYQTVTYLARDGI